MRGASRLFFCLFLLGGKRKGVRERGRPRPATTIEIPSLFRGFVRASVSAC